MARPYRPGPKEFVFAAGDGTGERVVAADPQEAYEAFSVFYRSQDGRTCTIDDEPAGQRLVLMPDRGVIVRSTGAEVSYLKVDRPNRYTPSAMLFFENGYAGLDRYGQWLADLADLDASPEDRGATRAATLTTEAAALEEVGRMWGDSGIVDPSDQWYVFFDSHGAEDDRAERAALLVLIEFLGLEQVEAPAGAADGEIWVRRDARLDAEFERWA
ncbi:hypothetical protein [Kribbella sp. NPDC051770]|uniref:hypothetical protein n=1 Tax=Kribbella sp. NPDC051770 TaxID=3155413 RepID=UPI00343FA8F2